MSASAFSATTELRKAASRRAPKHARKKRPSSEIAINLLAEAYDRIGKNPGKYLNKVWGEHDAGGTSVLYISNVDLSFLSAGHVVGPKPLPKTTAIAMEAVPFAFTGVMACMAGTDVDYRAPHED